MVRHSAATSLREFGRQADGPVPVLTQALAEDPDEMVRCRAADALCTILPRHRTTPETAAALASALGDRSAYVRIMAADGLCRLGDDPAAVPVLADALSDGNPNVRAFSLEALGRIGPRARPAALAISEAARRQSAVKQMGFADVLRRVGAEDEARSLLRELTENEDEWLRESARQALNVTDDSDP
jgi:HEAT repeat protein